MFHWSRGEVGNKCWPLPSANATSPTQVSNLCCPRNPLPNTINCSLSGVRTNTDLNTNILVLFAYHNNYTLINHSPVGQIQKHTFKYKENAKIFKYKQKSTTNRCCESNQMEAFIMRVKFKVVDQMYAKILFLPNFYFFIWFDESIYNQFKSSSWSNMCIYQNIQMHYIISWLVNWAFRGFNEKF